MHQLAAPDAASRQLLQIYAAVKKNPKNTDFRGPGMTVSSLVNSAGGALVGEFGRWTAEEQNSEACSQKQQRLHIEDVTMAKTKRPLGTQDA